MTKRKKLKSLKSLNKKAWKLFSIWVRKSEADFAGYVACCCCGKQYLWNSGDIHAGHWIHGRLEYDPRNIHPQCKNCNFKYNPNSKAQYAIYMANKYGAEEMAKIWELAYSKGNNYSRLELENIILKYGTRNI